MPASDVRHSYFSVTIEPSGRHFTVQDDETVLLAGIRQNISLPYGCKDGACGSCKCKKISGSVVHRNHQPKALSVEEEASGYVLTCCAVPSSNLVLESRQVTEVGAIPIKKMPTRISKLTRLGDDVMVPHMRI